MFPMASPFRTNTKAIRSARLPRARASIRVDVLLDIALYGELKSGFETKLDS